MGTNQPRNWKVKYTKHPGRWDDPHSSVDFAELVRCDNGNELLSAFVTTFEPWTLSFLETHFGHVDTTLFVRDGNIGDYDCDACDKALRTVGGLVWTCSECQYDVCSSCRGNEGVLTCPAGHEMRELYPGLFDREQGARVQNAVYHEDISCYHAEVEFDKEAEHRFKKSLRVVVPRRPETFCVHPKMMVLNFGCYIRVVISSFNMSEVQWANAGDVFWFADLNLESRPDPHLHRLGRESNLHAPLHDFLCSIGGSETALLLDRADWRSLVRSTSTQVHAVASLPGEYTDKRFGLRRLGDVLRHFPRFPPGDCPVRLQAWSIGGSSSFWYNRLASTLTQNFKESRESHLSESLHIVVHTPGKGHCRSFDERMVTRGCLWEDKSHPLFDEENEGVQVPWGWHSKVMYRLYPSGMCQVRGCKRIHGWAYVGSHNCSAASWGFLTPGKITIGNYELGIVIASLPAGKSGFRCGVCLAEAVPFPWSSVSSLVPYVPTPTFARKSMEGVTPFSGVVCTIPNAPTDCVPVRASPIRFTSVDDDSDDSEEEEDSDDQEDESSKPYAIPDSVWICFDPEARMPILRLPRKKEAWDGYETPTWPPPPGTKVSFDISMNHGVVHIYSN